MYKKGQRVRIKATSEQLISCSILSKHAEINRLIGVIVSECNRMPAVEFYVGDKRQFGFFIRNEFIFPLIENVE